MFSLLADAMFTATRTRTGKDVPEHHKDWADRFVPSERRKSDLARYKFNPYRDLW